MTGVFVLDWAILSVSLFNTILLFWLGLTVLLNAERQNWGIWLAGGGLLTGGVFFLVHTAILGSGLSLFSPEINLLWRLGWIPVVVLPFSWYLVNLWYAGFFDQPAAALHRRHRLWLGGIGLLVLVVFILLIFANPLPDLSQAIILDLNPTPTLVGVPVLIFFYTIYILFSTVLALDVLRRPGPSRRVMGDQARQRARPWLIATSVALLLASLLVAGVMLLLVSGVGSLAYGAVLIRTVSGFDLAIEGLIALGIVLLGQAVVAYEVFTGKALPRRGFLRQWRNAVILAAGFGLIVGGSFSYPFHPIYSLLLGTLLMTVFFALLGWRSYVERERFINDLRPFVLSQGMFEQLVEGDPGFSPSLDLTAPFHALCGDVLGARTGYLIALGSVAPLAGPPLSYPAGAAPDLPALGALASQCNNSETLFISVNPDLYAGARWGVPLWNERGLIGVFLLGEKWDGGLYTQEEIEIARASGERLIDTQASLAVASRLMGLQRSQFSQGQILDQQTRRVLHDEVLPRLHSLMLTLQAGETTTAVAGLGEIHHQLADLLRDLPIARAPEVGRLGLLGALRRAVAGELGGAFEAIRWEISPEAERRIPNIPPTTGEVIYYAAREAIRNAARHGRGPEGEAPLRLRLTAAWQSGLRLVVADNGVGLSASVETGTGGQGLALHSTMMAVVGGSLSVESQDGEGTEVILTLPIVGSEEG
jgi:signal transduction histidine kinase